MRSEGTTKATGEAPAAAALPGRSPVTVAAGPPCRAPCGPGRGSPAPAPSPAAGRGQPQSHGATCSTFQPSFYHPAYKTTQQIGPGERHRQMDLVSDPAQTPVTFNVLPSLQMEKKTGKQAGSSVTEEEKPREWTEN
ncbi:uncharacterized protein C11orf96-like [Pipra filicauda]|uniref:Uncharacterized protein C11orf96-like n=1 Tax=Pipra filicauda TaxID=649802 RepID=A0A7R5KL10_9PASS|nr:uncharacterized protein C11orf96-like [Pipra filicauda]